VTVATSTRPSRRRRAPGSEADPSAPIRTRALTKVYGDLVAVDALDLEVRAGEIFGLLGANGAGKTTTILMLLGLSEPTGGVARVVGLDPTRDPIGVKRRVGYLPDSVGFYGVMSGRQNLRYTARLNGLFGADAESRIHEVLEQVGMASRADDRTDEYSRGMLQRLGIADALLKDPDVLILDEPTASIDPLGVVEILELLRRLVDERGITILLSSHLLDQVQEVCDRVGIFAAGRLVGIGTVPQLAGTFGDGAGFVEVAFGTREAAKLDHAEARIRSMAGVVEIRRGLRSIDPWTVVVQPLEAAGLVRAEILGAAVADDLGLTAIRAVMPSLQDIYRRAVVGVGGSAEVLQ
jgi:ABC-2 type transport system ATP-binding protein